MSEIPAACAGASSPLGLYVHVPFCTSTCDFCAFYQTRPTATGIAGYLAGITRELELVARDRPVQTVFWGGGTPGLLSPQDLHRLGKSVRAFAGDRIEEWTVEMAPASVTVARLAALREIGVTRISMGAQSFDPSLLEALGRQHTRDQIMRAYERVRSAGFASVSLDLMFALPGQTEAQWRDDLGQALVLKPDHLSTYCLTFEEDTKLWVQLAAGQVKLDAEHEARLYETTWQVLAEAGYAQYEVANFAQPGHRCRHNLATWHMHEWIGIGPAAASQHHGWRASNAPDLTRWLEGLARGERMTEDRVALTPDLLAEDSLIFGLRLTKGVNLADLMQRFPSPAWEAAVGMLDDLMAEGLATRRGDCIALTTAGRLMADAVGEAIMSAMA